MRALVLLICLFWPLAALAQDDDPGFLTGFLQDTLSDAGRDVQITGFRGALSSHATIERLTIADEDGIWFTAEEVVLDWTRSALFAGRVEINEFSAARIVMPRLPGGGDDSPEVAAGEFALPELPVSVHIGTLLAERVELGAPVLGQPVVLRAEGSAALANAAGEAQLIARRIDGSRGEVRFAGAFDPATGQLSLDLGLDEAEGGIAATLLDLPGTPSLAMQVAGDGPIDDFTADIRLATDGRPRVTGTATTTRTEDGTRAFRLDVGGDVAAFLPPGQRAFFQGETRLGARARRLADGTLALDSLNLSGPYLTLSGDLTLDPNGWPVKARLRGTVEDPSGAPVPMPPEGTTLRRADIELLHDAATGPGWAARFMLADLATPGLAVPEALLTATGRITPTDAGIPGAAEGRLDLQIPRVISGDPALADMMQDGLSGGLDFDIRAGEPITLSNLALRLGPDALTGEVRIEGLETGLRSTGALVLNATTLARYLPGAEGAVQARISGTVTPLSGAIDLALEGAAQDLAAADMRLPGQTGFAMALRRDKLGLAIEGLRLDNPALNLSGELSLPDGKPATGRARLGVADFAMFQPLAGLPLGGSGVVQLDGSGTIETGHFRVTAEGTADGLRIDDLNLRGATVLGFTLARDAAGVALDNMRLVHDAFRLGAGARLPEGAEMATVTAEAELNDLSLFAPLAGLRMAGAVSLQAGGEIGRDGQDFDLQTSGTARGLRLGPTTLDPVLAGTTRFSARAARNAGTLRLHDLVVDGSNVTLRAAGGDAGYDLTARLRDIGLLVSDLSGAAAITGTARPEGAAWRINADATGPGSTNATVAGRYGPGNRADLTARGDVPLALINRFIAPRQIAGRAQFDLVVNGPLALDSVTGRITTRDTRLIAPQFDLTIQNIGGSVRLANGRAVVDLAARPEAGGALTVSGPVTLSAPYDAALVIQFNGAALRDPTLYDTSVDGFVSLNGALTGGALIKGRLQLGPTTLQIPSTGMTSLSAIPPIRHEGAPRDVRRTLERADIDTGTRGARQAQGPVYPLDIRVSAPGRIFVRGRGVDAELGGALTLTGTTHDMIPQGRFDLVRGRIDILTQRLTLTEGYAQLQGSLDPWLRLVATTIRADTEISVIIEGLASDPEIHFTSDSGLPEDEVLALLIFGRGIGTLSAFQALELASAVATLAGRGGEGIVSKLRRGFGLDDLDVTTTEEGTTEVRAGKYLSDNVYSDVVVGDSGKARIELNLDLSPNVTVKGKLGSGGNSGLGLFFEKDY